MANQAKLKGIDGMLYAAADMLVNDALASIASKTRDNFVVNQSCAERKCSRESSIFNRSASGLFRMIIGDGGNRWHFCHVSITNIDINFSFRVSRGNQVTKLADQFIVALALNIKLAL